MKLSITKPLSISLILGQFIFFSCATSDTKSDDLTGTNRGIPPYKAILSISANNRFNIHGTYTDSNGEHHQINTSAPWSMTIRDVHSPGRIHFKGYLSHSNVTRSINGEASLIITDLNGTVIYKETDTFGPILLHSHRFLTDKEVTDYTRFDLGIN